MTDAERRRDNELIERLRARAADPARRTDAHRGLAPSGGFPGTAVRTLDLGGLFGMGRSLAQDLGRVVEMNRSGTLDPEVVARANDLEARMSNPVEPEVSGPASEAAIARAETAVGMRLPAFLRRVYAEVGDGGFGPGSGLMSLDALAAAYRDLTSEPPGPRGEAWPHGLLPVVAFEPGYLCVEASSGRVVDWDEEELADAGRDAWQRAFKDHAPSVETWLREWVDSRHPDEVLAEQMQGSMVQQAREARAAIGRMTPAERAAMGLPEEGWERVVWGGIGLEDDEQA